MILNGEHPVAEADLLSKNSINENSISDSCSQPVGEQPASNADLVSAISESLVTVTKNEIIEESVSNVIVQQEVTEVISNSTVLNGETESTIEIKEELPLKNQDCTQSEKTESNEVNVSNVLLEGNFEVSKSETVETEKENIKENFEEVSKEISQGENNKDIVVENQNPPENTAVCPTETPVQKEIVHEISVQQSDEVESSKEQDSSVTAKEPRGDDHLGTSSETQISSDLTGQNSEEPPPSNCELDPEDLPLPPTKGYCLDFLDSLDDPNFNPFATKTAVRNTPPPSPEAGRKLPPLKPAVKKKKEAKSKDTEPPAKESEEKSPEVSNTVSEGKVNDPAAESKPSDESKSGQLLEITTEDSPKPPSRPPTKVTRKSVPNKKPVSKPAPKPKVIEKNNNSVDEKSVSETESKPEQEEEVPIPPSKGYNLDFLDNLDDPNFNPFATTTTVSNSPPKEGFTLPDDQEEKPKTKVVSPKKSAAKKGFSVIKTKAKASPGKQEQEPKTKQVESSEDKSDSVADTPQDVEENPKEDDLPAPPKKGYNLAFLDDPNFDPFKSQSSVNNQTESTTTEVSKPEREVVGGPCSEEPAVSVEKTPVGKSPQSEISTPEAVSKPEHKPLDNQVDSSVVNEVVNSDVSNKLDGNLSEANSIEKKDLSSADSVDSKDTLDIKEKTLVNGVTESEHLEKKSEPDSKSVESTIGKNEIKPLKTNTERVKEPEKGFCLQTDESESFYERDLGLPKVPSIGTIGHLDSLEFAQLLGNEASRLAEEFMNCSTDSGLPDSDDSAHLKLSNVDPNMADKDRSALSRLSAHLDENVNPFQKNSKLQRSPPLGKRDVCGADGGDSNDNFDPFKPRRSFLRESAPGEDRQVGFYLIYVGSYFFQNCFRFIILL